MNKKQNLFHSMEALFPEYFHHRKEDMSNMRVHFETRLSKGKLPYFEIGQNYGNWICSTIFPFYGRGSTPPVDLGLIIL